MSKSIWKIAGANTLSSGVTTFGQVFKQGELPAGTGLKALVGGVEVAVQLGVKTTYADGSAKMAALQQALKDGSASFWQEGPLATQARAEVPPQWAGETEQVLQASIGQAQVLAEQQRREQTGGRIRPSAKTGRAAAPRRATAAAIPAKCAS